MLKITPFLWYDNNALEAAQFYTTLFKNSTIESTMPGPNGSVMGVTFVLEGQRINALNGGPHYKLTEAFSLFVDCDTQAEVDTLWAKLTADGGAESMCGWLKDKFGLSWQIIPRALGELMGDSDPVKAGRVMQAMLKMQKIEIKALQDAYDGK